jgi:hypothetical protein
MAGKPLGIKHWRNTSLNGSLLGVETTFIFFPLLFVLDLGLGSLILMIVAYIVFFILKRKGIRISGLLRYIKAKFNGPVIEKRPYWKRRRLNSYLED